MVYKIIPKEELNIYTECLKKFGISFKTFPLSFNQQKEYTKVSIKLGYSFINLRQELDFYKELRIYSNRFKSLGVN